MTASFGSGKRNGRPALPGPRNPISSTLAFQRAPLEFLANQNANHGDIWTFRLATSPVIVLNHPHYVKRVLQDNARNYVREAAAHQMARKLFGDGVATVSGEQWRRARRLMQPGLHYQQISALCETMREVVISMLDRWERVASSRENVLNLTAEMREFTFRIVVKCLFTKGMDENTLRRFLAAIETVDRELAAYMAFPLVPLSVPTPGHRRFWKNQSITREIIRELIHRYRDDDADYGDLMSTLLQARDDETDQGMSAAELEDQVFSLLFAGHETTANILTWAWYLIHRHPDVEERMRAEVDEVLDGSPPTMEDINRLTYMRTVIDETQRIYPVAWQQWRRARDEDEIRNHRIPAQSDIFFSIYHLHRHPEFWPDPERFDPDRFSPAMVATRDRSAYIPFGAGQHLCMGNHFALTEIHLVLASAWQRFRFELTSHDPIRPLPLITTTTERPVMVTVRTR